MTSIVCGVSVLVVIGQSFAGISEGLFGHSSGSNSNTSNDDHSKPGGQEDEAVEECEASVLNAFEAETESTDEHCRQREDQKHNEYSILGILDFRIFLTDLVQNVGVSDQGSEDDHND